MFEEKILNEILKNRIEIIEQEISKEYHKKINFIEEKDSEERNNIKMKIISELYYKQGFKDGVIFADNNTKK